MVKKLSVIGILFMLVSLGLGIILVIGSIKRNNQINNLNKEKELLFVKNKNESDSLKFEIEVLKDSLSKCRGINTTIITNNYNAKKIKK